MTAALATTTLSRIEFEQGLEAFLALATRKSAEYYGQRYASLEPPVYSVERGQKFVRVVARSHGSGHVHCFLEIATGKIVKAAGYKAPAKRANGELQSQYSLADLEAVEAAFDPHGGYLYCR